MPRGSVVALALKGLGLRSQIRQSIADSINRSQLGLQGVSFAIHHSVEIRTPDKVRLGHNCILRRGVIINGRSEESDYGIDFGDDTYLKEDCYFDAYGGFIQVEGRCAFGQGVYVHGGGGVRVGSHVIIGPRTAIIASNHDYRSPELPIMLQGDVRQGITIGTNVWIGAHAVLLDGIDVGDNCVVAAGTILTHSVPSGTLVYDVRRRRERRIF